MDGKIMKIDGKFPVTTTKAVYIDGTNKTLQDAINNKEFGGEQTSVNVNGRASCIFAIRGGRINLSYRLNHSYTMRDVIFSVPKNDYDRYRRMYIYFPDGRGTSVDFPDGVLELDQALVYDISTREFTIKTGTWGNIPCSQNEYILLYNQLGNISGELLKYCSWGSESAGFKIKNIEAEDIVGAGGSTQGIIVIDDAVYTSYHASDDHSTYGKLGKKDQNICHMNAPEYNAEKDMLIVGNGSKVAEGLDMKGWLFPNFKYVFNNSAKLDFYELDKIELSFTDGIFDGEYKAQLCFGYGDCVYLATSDNLVIRKLKLCKGTEQGEYGDYVERLDGGYNGTYDIIGTWRSMYYDIIGGMAHYKGCLYFGVKGKYGIRKCILKTDGVFDSEYIVIDGFYGDMQGIAISGEHVFAYTDYKGYKFDVSEL